ncbi:hypothetical protein CRUP_009203 [Coryphaenoides rupestris]|nr:hypothetical protein CRUP_009203 [Coryphaenoides rupestris]
MRKRKRKRKKREEEEEEEGAEEENRGVQGVDMEEYKHAMLELEGLKLEEPQTDPQDAGNEDPTGEEETETQQEPAVGGVDGVDEGEGQEEGGEEAGSNHDGRGEEEDACPELLDLSAANREFKPFRDEDSLLHLAEHRMRRDSENTVGSVGSCSTIPPEVVRQKIRRQLGKQQKSAQKKRLQRGEANLVTKARRENDVVIKSSLDCDSFWG